jgi:hypothetical protein
MDDEAIFWERVNAMPLLEAEQELVLRRERYAVEQQELTLARAAAEQRRDHTTHAALGRQMFVLAQQVVSINERIKYLRRIGDKVNWRRAVAEVLGQEAVEKCAAWIAENDEAEAMRRNWNQSKKQKAAHA